MGLPQIKVKAHNMDIGMFCAVFTVLMHWFIFHLSAAAFGSHQVKLDVYTDKTVKSLENVVDFYKNNFDKVNLDSIYGLRVAQGSLATILKTLPTDHYLFQKLTSLHNTMTDAAEKALPYLKEYQPDYYYQFKPVVDKPWSIFQDFKKIKNKTTPSNPEISKHYFDEQISDNCMTEMIGTNAYSKHPCHVSFNCVELMTSNDLKRYGNTHQILYFLFGYQTGCRIIIEKKFQKFCGYLKKHDILNVPVDKFLEKKCGQILVEMNQLKENVVVNGDTDLFMEQGLVCSMLGYEDFLDRTILANMFLWQDKERGCFGRKNSHIKEYDTRHVMRRITMRKILYERELDDGCSSHETGVATGLLSIYLRWLLLDKLKLK